MPLPALPPSALPRLAASGTGRFAGLALAASLGLAACTPPAEHVRVDVRIDAQGRCQVEGETLDCQLAGTAMAARHPGQTINAVILAGPNADPAGRQAVIASLAKAQVTHLQFGDPATMAFESAASRPLVER